ncbi:Tim44 domain-containing protein [Paraferrimonas sp. SM1919]|uniref:Tim44 domain-containing protein n=1 Tax=Paraferrimonas sp. SM1919 TaxID=2662263 RepID=UPI0013D0D04D|nr:TIM44-like domain-containing protein [Paraferrimonas sp. SM1919]
MKSILSTLTLVLLTLSLVFSGAADAKKRFGGGKTFGKSYKTAPAKQQPASNQQTPAKQDATKPSSKKGMMGGILGGLLAGGLLAALLSGGFDGFEGLQIMDMLLMAGVAFLLFKVFKSVMASKRQGAPQAAAAQGPAMDIPMPKPAASAQFESHNPATTSAVSSGDDVPHNYPAGFDKDNFINGALNHYRTLQKAWDENDLGVMAEYLEPTILKDLIQARAQSEISDVEIMFLNAEIVRADSTPFTAQLSVKFSGRARDKANNEEEAIDDVWHLERNLTADNAPWLIVGIEA